MISIVFKNVCTIAKISTDTKIRVYEKMQDCSLVFPGHLRLPTGRFCVVQSTSHSHRLQQVLAKFRLSMPLVSFVCTKDGGGLSLQDVQITSFFIFLIEYKEACVQSENRLYSLYQ